jgi:4-hydroxy-tetrahydrodipicolinate synthase
MKDINSYRTWTAIVTPMDAKGAIDFESLGNLLHRQEAADNGVVLLGSTGEGLALSEEEKREVVRYSCQKRLKIPLVVGVGGFNLRQTLNWLSFCETQPIQGYLLVMPIYARPGAQGQFEWFKALLDAVKRPCILYNIPKRAGAELSFDVVAKLKDHPNFWAIKEASGDLKAFAKYHELAPKAHMFSGCDDLMPELATIGAYGIISVMSNLWPEATHRYIEDIIVNNEQPPQAVWKKASQLSNNINPVSAKVYLHKKGLISSPILRPPLSALDVSNIDELLDYDQKIQSWMDLEEAPHANA